MYDIMNTIQFWRTIYLKLTKMFDYYLNQYVIDEKITGIKTARCNIENLERFFKNKQIEKITADDIDDYKTFRRRRKVG